MDFKTFTAGPDDNDRRLDRIIRKFIPADSLGGVYKAIRKGLIKINDKRVDSGTRVFQGDEIKIADFLLLSEKNQSKKENSYKFPYEIVFQNENIIAINKPYDKIVQGNATALNVEVENFYKNNFKNESLSFKPGPLHRLDRKTTGILCFSLSLEGARWFCENISSHIIKKHYVGIAEGNIKETERWEDYIDRAYNDENSFQTVKIGIKKENGKKAVTTAIPLAYGNYQGKEYTLVQFNIETGRTHQIRAQSAFHKHPLLGDTAYGGTKIREKEYYLHARELNFPADNEINLPEKIIAPIPEDFRNFLKSSMQDYEKCVIL